MATAHGYENYALMLNELGINVTARDIVPSDVEVLPPLPYKERDTSHDPEMIPSFIHMEQLQLERGMVPYKRITHFVQHLNQVTARVEYRDRGGLLNRLRKAGVDVKDPCAYFKIRLLLKRWKFTSPHYRCIFSMLHQMGGKVLKLDYQQEMALRTDFMRLEDSFRLKVQGETRKNFISYYLIIQLLLQKYRIPCFYKLPSIKDSAKFLKLLRMYEQIISQGSFS